jgi:hypothetical protein
VACVPLLLAALTAPRPEARLDDLWRFPPPEVSAEACRWLQGRLDHLDRAAPHAGSYHEREALYAERERVYRLWYVWDSLRVAQLGSWAPAARLRWLAEVRRRLPPDWWAAGRMPDPWE